MLSSLLSAKEFCMHFSSTKDALFLSEREWRRVEDCLQALIPCKKANLKLQTEDLVPGDVYGTWMECKLLTGEVKTNFAKKLVDAMEKREINLLNNEALLASLCLDPRYLTVLTEENSIEAKRILIKVWNTLLRTSFELRGISSINSTTSSETSQVIIFLYYLIFIHSCLTQL